jgi:hypothetical protein
MHPLSPEDGKLLGQPPRLFLESLREGEKEQVDIMEQNEKRSRKENNNSLTGDSSG